MVINFGPMKSSGLIPTVINYFFNIMPDMI